MDAQLQPQTYLSIAQDAVDATQKGIPKSLEFSKSEDSYKLKSKIIINMVHGESVHFYIMPENIHGGPNESIEALHRTLAICKQSRGKLPPILYLQVDNSSRECKNTYTLAYLTWLVATGVFTRIVLAMHPVGHTHNECDQSGSRIRVAVNGTELMCN